MLLLYNSTMGLPLRFQRREHEKNCQCEKCFEDDALGFNSNLESQEHEP